MKLFEGLIQGQKNLHNPSINPHGGLGIVICYSVLLEVLSILEVLVTESVSDGRFYTESSVYRKN